MQYVLNAEIPAEELDSKTVFATRSVINEFNGHIPILDNIVIINRLSDFVVSQFGVYSLENYFSSICCYDNYPIDYWLKYQNTYSTPIILDPSETKYAGQTSKQYVTPIVFGTQNSNLIIYNLGAKRIYDSFSQLRFTSKSRLYMQDRATQKYISGGDVPSEPILIRKYFDELSVSGHTVGTAEIDGKTFVMLTSQNRSSLLGFTQKIYILTSFRRNSE